MKNSLRKILLLLGTAGQIYSAHAQNAANYVFSTGTNASLNADLNGNTIDMASASNALDANGNAAINTLDFPFSLMGFRVTKFMLNQLGVITVGNDNLWFLGSYNLSASMFNGSNYLSFSAFAASMKMSTSGGSVRYKTFGTAPNRTWVVEYKDMTVHTADATLATSNDATFQTRIYEGTGIVEYVYGEFAISNITAPQITPYIGFARGSTSFAALKTSTLSVVTSGSYTANYNPASVIGLHPVLNSPTEGSRRYFRFTPVIPDQASSVSISNVTGETMKVSWAPPADTSHFFSYTLYKSLDGINYSYVGQFAKNVLNYTAVVGYNTTCYWKICTASEGTESAGLIESATTLNPLRPIQNGAWGNPAVWSSGTVPACSDSVLIPNGITVNVNSAGCYAKNITIDTAGVLALSSGGALTVGCTGNNAFVKNTGTISVGAGTLAINGSLSIENRSRVYQSGGEILIDGNDNGNIASSVATGIPLLGFGTPQLPYNTGTIALTGGKITIVDPHAAADSGFAVAFYPSLSNYGIGGVDTGHTIQFGNGISTDPGGSNLGFRNKIASVPDTRRILFGKILVNAGAGATRIVGALHVDGDAEIVSGVWQAANNCIGGSLKVNGGTLLANGLVNLCAISVYNSGTMGGRDYKFAVTRPVSVSVSNGGQIVNSLTNATANFSGLALRNNSATGVTFNTLNPIAGTPVSSDVSMSGTLTLGSKVGMAPGGVFLFLRQDVTNLPTVSGYFPESGYGFLPGVTLARAYTSPLGAQPNFPQNENTPIPVDYSVFPFVNASGTERTAWIKLTNLVAAGVYAVTYNEVPGTTSVSFTDAASNVITRSNSNWSISTLGTSPASTTPISIAFRAPGIVPGVVAPSFTHIVQANAGVGGYVQGSINPLYGIRNELTTSQLTSGPFYMGISGTQPVPVTLMYFKGEQRQRKNVLYWRTAAETNFSHFELQRSYNGIDFSVLAKIEPHALKGSEYIYTDEIPFAGNNFYRLNMVDVDGKAELSTTVKLLAEQRTNLEITISPVPVTDKVVMDFEGRRSENGKVKIVDMSGRVWRNMSVSRDLPSISVDCRDITPGVYTIIYTDGSNTFRKTFSKK